MGRQPSREAYREIIAIKAAKDVLVGYTFEEILNDPRLWHIAEAYVAAEGKVEEAQRKGETRSARAQARKSKVAGRR